MTLAIIAALTKDHVIGKDNKLPWDMPADLNYFREKTKNSTVIMGRKTFESIGRPLPSRQNIIITRNKDFKAANCTTAHSLKEALTLATYENRFVIGGAKLYTEALSLSDTLYLTYIDADIKGDTYFPFFDRNKWKETESHFHLKDQENPFDYTFVTFEKRK